MKSLKGKKILVTGAEGFIGSHLVERLLFLNANVNAFVLYNFSNSVGNLHNLSKSNHKNLSIHFGDLRDVNTFSKIAKKCDVIINLAALIGIPYSYIAPKSYFETNTIGLMNILEIAENKKIIHTSTSEVYGTAKYTPIDEGHSLNGQSPYSASKIAADQLALSYYYSFGTNVSIIRPFNTFGPRQSDRAFIPTVINQLLSNKKQILLGDLSTKRDLTFVDDTVDGFINCIKSNNKITNGEIFNLGTGISITMEEIANFLISEINPNAIIKLDKKRIRPEKSEVLNLLSENKKAKNLIKWNPKYNSKLKIQKALKKTIDYFRDNKINTSSKYVV